MTALDGFDLILGRPWFNDYNPRFDWPSNTILSPFHVEAVATLATGSPTIQHLSASKMAKVLRKTDTELYVCSLREVVEALPSTTTLSPESAKRLQALLDQFQEAHGIFDEPSGLNFEAGTSHEIPLEEGSKVPMHGLRRMSPAELEELLKQLNWYLEKGWIRPSQSSFSAPVVFAKKSDGTLRFCLDYRSLNAITKKSRYPLPKIDELLDQLHGAQFFTSLDLSSAYHQIPMNPADIHKTAFRTRYGQYEFLVMPFGLTNAPATCQATMNEVLGPYIDKFAAIYLDDCLIWSKTEEDHLLHIQLVLEAFAKRNFKLKLSKCTFAQGSTKFLGFIVSKQGISVDPHKTSAIVDWPRPSTCTEVRSFLGFCNFYRRFIRNFSTIAAPLTALTSALKPFPPTLPRAAHDAFLALKAAMAGAPVLAIPFTGPDAEFDLFTDASRVGVGAVLEQDSHPVCFESRKLSVHEVNYPVHDLELLAVIHALKVFRHYLEGCKHFVLYTDHHSLQYFFRQKELSRRQVGWLETLVDFQSNMTIKYLPGEKNKADALSRLLTAESLYSTFEVWAPSLSSRIKALYAQDPFFSSKTLPSYICLGADGLYFHGDRICVPNCAALRTEIVAMFHDDGSAGHPGYMSTMNAIGKHYYWPRMSAFVRRYCTSCSVCQRTKVDRRSSAGLLHPHLVPTRPWDHIGMDLITDLPVSVSFDGQEYTAIATFVDLLTKQAFFVRTNKTVDARGMAHLYFENVYRLKGLSSKIVSDRDTRFTAGFWQTLFARLGTKLNMSTAHHPQTDGQAERVNGIIEQILRAYVHQTHSDWATWLPLAEFAYNSRQQASTTISPFEANYGYRPSTPATLNLSPSSDPDNYASRLIEIHQLIQRESEAAKLHQAAQANKHRRAITLAVGDEVWLDSSKLVFKDQPSSKFKDRFCGPFQILEQVSPVSYRLALPTQLGVHPVFHVSRLRLAVSPEPSEFPGRPSSSRPAPLATDFSYSATFMVDSLLDVRIEAKKLQFLVHWAAPYHDPKFDSWEPYPALKKLTCMHVFLTSMRYQRFMESPVFRVFAKRWPNSVPKLKV